MEYFIIVSLETHLFFARIMKEHALFLEAGFPCKDTKWIEKAEFFRGKFEELLKWALEMADGRIRRNVLESQEIVTCFTIPAEKKTSQLTGIPIDERISEMGQKLHAGRRAVMDRMVLNQVRKMNEKAISLLDGLIELKENILQEVKEGCLFNANYPLLIQHILREAKMYRSILTDLQRNGRISQQCLRSREDFWNQIMMEHAMFIRGLLDPSEVKLIRTADEFAMNYEELLEMAKKQDCRAMEHLTGKSLEETLKYREFKTAGAEGILECKIASMILPLLADHVLREANHYIRLLEGEK